MTEAQWKLVVDQQGVTIASDKFQFTTSGTRQPDGEVSFDGDQQTAMNSTESSYMEAVISQLQTMTRRTYGQYCGLGRALEIIGERWSMMLIRDLCVRPKTLPELHEGFPIGPPEILTGRLRELEHGGVIRQLPDQNGDSRYTLTEFGRELDTIIQHLALWGARLLGEPRPEDVVTTDSFRMALRTMFRQEAAAGIQVSYQIDLDDITVHAKINDGTIETGDGPLPDADLIFNPGPTLLPMLFGQLRAPEALDTGTIKYTGDPELLTTFTKLFFIPPLPADPLGGPRIPGTPPAR